jgi:hypothetical protein
MFPHIPPSLILYRKRQFLRIEDAIFYSGKGYAVAAGTVIGGANREAALDDRVYIPGYAGIVSAGTQGEA